MSIDPRQSIFREKSLERVASPDKLDQYIRVSNPAAWMVLAVIVLVLVAGCAWAFAATVPNVETCTITVENGCFTGETTLPDGTYSASVTVGEEKVSSMLLGD